MSYLINVIFLWLVLKLGEGMDVWCIYINMYVN